MTEVARWFLAAILCGLAVQSFAAESRLNFLVIAVDDLRPEIGSFGADHMHTPNMDRPKWQCSIGP